MPASRGKPSRQGEDMGGYYDEYESDMGTGDERETMAHFFRQSGNDTESEVREDVRKRSISTSSDDSGLSAQAPPTQRQHRPYLDHHLPRPGDSDIYKLREMDETLVKRIEELQKTLAFKEATTTKLKELLEEGSRDLESLRHNSAVEEEHPVRGCIGCGEKDKTIRERQARCDENKQLISARSQKIERLRKRKMDEEKRKQETLSKAKKCKTDLSETVKAIEREEREERMLRAEKKSLAPVQRVALKEDHVRRYRDAQTTCDRCKKLVTPASWYCCHDCDKYNLCGDCFKVEWMNHAQGRHSFTNMDVFMCKVVNLHLPHLSTAITKAGNYRCDTCQHVVYPKGKGTWYRCNECDDADMCGRCFDSLNYKQHKGGTHTFTDMFTLLLTKHGFPKVENSSSESNTKANRQPFSCMSCGRENLPSVFRCKSCASYNICQKCVITDAWYTHSRNVHDFTHVR